ncbi:TPA: hypothetical protein KRM68_001089 [Clostridioides difficile]|nr:hypothetical protein [Clostridioides difficile]MCC0646581.1 hypothetical protein [Clostridioides sp. ZZV14-6150]MCC0723804.1 hypothetical protein [Clostridioides sp. ZZV14-6104]MCC0742153.1 hypothetical protein [Clostridioides sp. ZZV14-6044]MCC0753120.1 hypothetical protein [Clostridioides sp. ZZV13-5731]MCT8897850.1 hypothetical protein [Clostridioides difficile]
MKITISYNQIIYQEEHIVFELSNLILDNPKLLTVLANIYILIGELKQKKNLDKEKQTKNIVRRVTKKALFSGWISEEIGQDFIRCWNEISSENLGKVLEQIISRIGPYDVEKFEDFHKSMEVKVTQTGMKNDFDVVFFERESNHCYKKGEYIDISGYGEFHECKKNICTYIPKDPKSDLDKRVSNKLKFIKATYELKKDNKFYIPTFFPMVKSQREFLQDYLNGEYNFIEILDIYQLENKIMLS